MQVGGFAFPMVFLAALAVTLFAASGRQKALVDVGIGDYTVKAEVADNFLSKAAGLMGRKTLREDRGMLFVFGEEGTYNFWMMNMSIPIDMIFIGEDKRVVGIVKDAQPCKPFERCAGYAPEREFMYVLETKANFTERHGVRVGSKVVFDLA